MAKKIKLPKKVAGLQGAQIRPQIKAAARPAEQSSGAGRACQCADRRRRRGRRRACREPRRDCQAGKKGAKKGVQAAALAGEAAQSAANAMIGVVRDAAHVSCQRRSRAQRRETSAQKRRP